MVLHSVVSALNTYTLKNPSQSLAGVDDWAFRRGPPGPVPAETVAFCRSARRHEVAHRDGAFGHGVLDFLWPTQLFWNLLGAEPYTTVTMWKTKHTICVDTSATLFQGFLRNAFSSL